MTTLIATSVIRDKRLGARHEGAYFLDLEQGRVARVLDTNPFAGNRSQADWAGGIRGVAFDEERVFVASGDELFAFSPELEPVGSWRSPYLKDCQGMAVYRRRLFLVSAACDSILGFDLDDMRFSLGLHLAAGEKDYRAMPFDPAGQKGPQFVNHLELNSVHCDEQGMFISGRRTHGLLMYGGRRIIRYATLPEGVHDARPWRDGVLFNDSEAGVVRFVTPELNHVFRIPRWPAEDGHVAAGGKPASSPFPLARGLCTVKDRTVAGGSSPSTVTLHDVEAMKTKLTIKLSDDPRSAIASLAVWPFETEAD